MKKLKIIAVIKKMPEITETPFQKEQLFYGRKQQERLLRRGVWGAVLKAPFQILDYFYVYIHSCPSKS